MSMKVHPAAELFPMMDDGRLVELAASIRSEGLHVPLVRCDGMLLDGRNRAKACESAEVEPHYTDFVGNPYEYVWALNGQRRDLEPGQRGCIRKLVSRESDKWEAVQRKHDERSKKSVVAHARQRDSDGKLTSSDSRALASTVPSRDGTVDAKAAESHSGAATRALATKARISEATAYRVEILDGKRPDLVAKVAAGEMKLTEAMRQVKKDEVSKRLEPLPAGKYRVIYADPPWQYNDSREGLVDYSATAADDHYPTMSVAALSVLGVAALGDEHSVLFCWATFPLLDDALQVVRSWGFKYKTAFVWSKQRTNFGHYHNASAELLLVCTRGSCTPDANQREDQVQVYERTGRHSEKPEHFREMIDRLYPQQAISVDRIELFRRGEPPKGWHVWGNEVKQETVV